MIWVMLGLMITSNSKQLYGQDIDSSEVVARAKLIDTEKTNKRHQSYFFTFEVLKVLSGQTKIAQFTSQEISRDFGGSQILSKLYPKGDDQLKEVIIKFKIVDSEDDSDIDCQIIWVAERERRKSLERLEQVIEDYSSVRGISVDQEELLKEREGKLFFSDVYLDNPRLAVEVLIGSGNWIITELENWKE